MAKYASFVAPFFKAAVNMKSHYEGNVIRLHKGIVSAQGQFETFGADERGAMSRSSYGPWRTSY